MNNVCNKLGLKTINLKEKNPEKIKEITGNPDIKGVRGTDKRHYLIDLLRIHPRDSNYEDAKENSACIVRDKLLKIYNIYQVNPKISLKTLAKYGEFSE